MNYELSEIRTAWRDAFLALWHENIRDTQPGYAGDVEQIADLYREIGWNWEVADGYDEDEGHEWCGVGAAVAGLRLGDHLEPDQCVPVSIKPEIAEFVLPSTGRLYSHRLPRDDEWDHAGVSPAREIDVEAVDVGDILTVYPDRKRWGSHIALAAGAPRNGRVPTIEANASGELPDGSRGEGVVRQTRPFDQIAVAYRFLEEHFVSRTEE